MTRRSSHGASCASRRRRACRGAGRVVCESFEELLRREELDARSGELERQGQTIEAKAERADCGRRFIQVRMALARPLEKERDGLIRRRGGRSNSASPWMRSGSREVTRSRNDGDASTSAAMSDAACGSSCSTLSSTRCVRRWPIAVASASGVASGAPRRPASWSSSCSPAWERASGTKIVAPSASSARSRASSIAKRVLPTPPGPTIVSMRGSRSSQIETARWSSDSRPRKRVAGVGSSTAPGVRRDGKSPVPSCGASSGRRSP